MQPADRSARLDFTANHVICRTLLLALCALVISCDSTEPARGVTGVWNGRISYARPNDTLTLSLEQKGSEVSGWGLLRPAHTSSWAYQKFFVSGTLSGGQLDLGISTIDGQHWPTYLRGPVTIGLFESNLGGVGGDEPIPAILQRTPAPRELTGTWALSSTTGETGLEQLFDTIVVSADGRARRHRELIYAGQPYVRYAMQAIVWRRGAWIVIAQGLRDLETDSLLAQSGEWVHRRRSVGGTDLTDHYTRVSVATDLTQPPRPALARNPVLRPPATAFSQGAWLDAAPNELRAAVGASLSGEDPALRSAPAASTPAP